MPSHGYNSKVTALKYSATSPTKLCLQRASLETEALSIYVLATSERLAMDRATGLLQSVHMA